MGTFAVLLIFVSRDHEIQHPVDTRSRSEGGRGEGVGGEDGEEQKHTTSRIGEEEVVEGDLDGAGLGKCRVDDAGIGA